MCIVRYVVLGFLYVIFSSVRYIQFSVCDI